MSTRRTALALTALALAACATPARAAKPFVLDSREQARNPAIAVDAAGTAHIVWNEYRGAGGPGDLVHYCQVPRNARKCARQVTLAAPVNDVNGPRVLLPGDGRVLVLTSRCCQSDDVALRGVALYLFTSSDGGASFSGPVHIGDNGLGYGDAALGPGPFRCRRRAAGPVARTSRRRRWPGPRRASWPISARSPATWSAPPTTPRSPSSTR